MKIVLKRVVNGVREDEMTKDNHNSIFMRNILRRFRESKAGSWEDYFMLIHNVNLLLS